MGKIAFVDKEVVFSARFEPENPALAAVSFAYRPLTGAEMARFQQEMQGGPIRTYEAAVKVITKHVASWSAGEDSGEMPSPQNEDAVKRLEHSILIGIATLIVDSANEAGEAVKNS